ncbi:MAG: ribose 5-phosphate isomerase B [Sphingomonadaceae bacterium]|nr:ribose 5-phosphate isomerase B [Sphingomonadaceae bacterium]
MSARFDQLPRAGPTVCLARRWRSAALAPKGLCISDSPREAALPYRVAIAADHAAWRLKAELVGWLEDAGHEVIDLGTASDDSVDYPDYGYHIAEAITAGEAERGVALCGSGIGISIAVNRHPACRCALVSDNLGARLARAHNDANVIAMGARLIGIETAKDCLAAFLTTEFLGERHIRRVEKLSHPHFEKEPL